MLQSYDVMYQEWLTTKRVKDYALADAIRTEFEKTHALTIFAEGEMPVEGLTVLPMKATAWHRKFSDNPKLVEAFERHESRFGPTRMML